MRSSSNADTREMYIGVVDQKFIIIFCWSICYPIFAPSKLYEENQSTIKPVLVGIITTQDQPLEFLITALYDYHLRQTFVTVHTRSNMQLAYLNSGPHGGKIFRYLVDFTIGNQFYPPCIYDYHRHHFFISFPPLLFWSICYPIVAP